MPGMMCLRSVAPRATGSARRVASVALSILAKAALVGAKMVAGAMASTVFYCSIFIYVLIIALCLTCVILAAVTAATKVENLSSATRVASSGAEPEWETVTGGRKLVGRLVTYTGGVRGVGGL